MLADFDCPDCGNERTDKYFSTWQQSDEPQACSGCGAVMVKRAPSVVFHAFKPFTHMTKDQKVHRISTERQRQEMMKRYGLETHSYNDTLEAKVDPREFQACIREEKRDFPERHRKLKEKVKIIKATEAEALAARAKETKFETVRA